MPNPQLFPHSISFSLRSPRHLSALRRLSLSVQTSLLQTQSHLRTIQSHLRKVHSYPRTTSLLHTRLTHVKSIHKLHKRLHKSHLLRLLFSPSEASIHPIYKSLQNLQNIPSVKPLLLHATILHNTARSLSAPPEATARADISLHTSISQNATPHLISQRALIAARTERIQLKATPVPSRVKVRLLSGAQLAIETDLAPQNAEFLQARVRNVGCIDACIVRVECSQCEPLRECILLPGRRGPRWRPRCAVAEIRVRGADSMFVSFWMR